MARHIIARAIALGLKPVDHTVTLCLGHSAMVVLQSLWETTGMHLTQTATFIRPPFFYNASHSLRLGLLYCCVRDTTAIFPGEEKQPWHRSIRSASVR